MKTSLSAVRKRVDRLAERSSCEANLVNWDELVARLQSARHEDLYACRMRKTRLVWRDSGNGVTHWSLNGGARHATVPFRTAERVMMLSAHI